MSDVLVIWCCLSWMETRRTSPSALGEILLFDIMYFCQSPSTVCFVTMEFLLWLARSLRNNNTSIRITPIGQKVQELWWEGAEVLLQNDSFTNQSIVLLVCKHRLESEWTIHKDYTSHIIRMLWNQILWQHSYHYKRESLLTRGFY